MRAELNCVRIAAVACAFILFGLTFIAPATTVPASAAAADPVRIIVGAAQEPDTLNPFKMVLSMSYTINFLVYDTLTSVDEDLNFGPQLATSWESSPDNLTWTFHLVEDAVWHDGEPVTSDDVKFTFDLIRFNENQGALWIDYLLGVDDIQTPDPYTVKIITTEPKATMLTIMIPILPEHIWSAVPAKDIDKVDPWDPDYFPSGPIGSGPFILDSWEKTLGEIRLLKNPDYFMGEVNVDEVLFKTFGSEAALVTAMQGKEIDIATWVPASQWEEILEDDDISGQEVSSASFFELGINCATEEWREAFPQASDNLETTNLSVRQAIAMATDKDYIVNDILEGLAEPGVSIIPKATEFWFYNLSEEDKWDYQIDAANDLLDAAGYGVYNVDGVRENETSGVALEFSLHFRKDYTDEEKAAEKIAASLREIGIEVTLVPVSEGVLWNDWMGCKYDLFIWGWDCDIDPNFMLSTMTTAQQPVDPQDSTKWGDAFWCNETYDQMYLDQQGAVNVTERQAIIHDMQAMLYEQCPYVVLYYPMGLYAYHEANFENFPDMESHPGLVPEYSWFYFEITPVGSTSDPENVEAGPDQLCSVNETLFFSGYAEDQDTVEADLNWTWTFVDPDDSTEELYGKDVYYNFSQIGDVTVTLLVTDPDSGTGSDSLNVEVTEMSDTAGWLKGYVKDDSSESLKGALVDASVNARVSDTSGFYSMPLEEGGHTVEASKVGYGSASADVELTAGNVTWLNFTLSLTSGTLEVQVYDSETGLPIESATVKITYSDTTKTHTTDEDGLHVFELVSEGVIDVTVTANDYVSNTTTAVVTAGETTVLTVHLDPEKDSGVGALAIAAIALLVLAVIAAAAFYMLKKKGKGGEEAPSDETFAPPEEQSPPSSE
ncbi:MAG: carboxypeptidase regulatory-like domain-containing protein [Methanobacteriota archaeon]|nr:MAG: carboxypeptidase regulatory-like domain-containing protein [Euryarchaeota archaeon]